MGLTIAEKIIKNHLVQGSLERGSEIALRIDQTLTQDATGTMAYLEFEAMGTPRVKTELSVAYIDHNTLQCGFENADDHAYIRSAAKKFGVSKSSVHKDVTSRLYWIDRSLYEQVRTVLEENKRERHLRGGAATREKYRKLQEK